MAITWRDQMSVGHPVIDGDHKALIDILNTFENLTRNGAAFIALDQTFRELAEYTKIHFAREEALQREIGYPLRDTHQEKHRVLVARLLAAYKRFKQKRERLTAEGVDCDHHSYAELLGILNAWLLEHILQEDMKLKPHIQRHLESRLVVG